jgi:excisionase family DNA binding protein
VNVDLAQLASLPALVQKLEERIAELEAKLATPDDGQLLDTDQAADLLRMRPQAVRQAAWRGAIPYVRIGRRLRFRRSSLLALR